MVSHFKNCCVSTNNTKILEIQILDNFFDPIEIENGRSVFNDNEIIYSWGDVGNDSDEKTDSFCLLKVWITEAPDPTWSLFRLHFGIERPDYIQ